MNLSLAGLVRLTGRGAKGVRVSKNRERMARIEARQQAAFDRTFRLRVRAKEKEHGRLSRALSIL